MSETDSINGWKPPVIYDVMTDQTRIATQADIDRMERVLRNMGQFYSDVRAALAQSERNAKEQA